MARTKKTRVGKKTLSGRIIRGVMKDLGCDLAISNAAVNLLREATEAYAVGLFEKCGKTVDTGSRALVPKDVRLARLIWRP